MDACNARLWRFCFSGGFMAQYDGSIRINTEITAKQAEKELKSLGSSMSKTADKIASLRSKMDSLKDVKLPTQEYKEIQTQIENTEKKINDLQARQEKFLATGGKESSSTYKRMQYDIDELKASLPYLKGELQELINSGRAFTLGSDTDEYTQMSAKMQQLNQQMEADTRRQSELQSSLAAEEQRLADIKANATVSDQEIINKLERIKQLEQEIADLKKAGVTTGYKDYDERIQKLSQLKKEVKDYNDSVSKTKGNYKKLSDTAKQSLDKIGKATKKSNGLLGTMASRFKGLVLSLLIFNQISKAFGAMTNAIQEGFGNFYKGNKKFKSSVDELRASMLTLKNSFAAAFSPIVQIAIPYIQKLIGWITSAINMIGQFISALTGKKTYTKAIKQTAGAFEDAAGAANDAKKAAEGYLSPIDEINKYNSKNDENSGSGGSGQMFEEIPINRKLLGFLDKIYAYTKEIKDAFVKGFWYGLGDWEYRVESIKKSIANIKDSLVEIFTDPSVLSAADGWVLSVAYALGTLVGATASIGLTIATNIVGGIEKYLTRNKDRIKKYLISMFDIWEEVNYMFADLFHSVAYVFEAFASEQGQQLTANIIGIFTDAFMGITELASKLFRDISNIIIQPFVDNKEAFRTALEGFLDVLSEVTGTIKEGIDETFDKLNEVYDEHFKPFFDSVANGLSDTAGKFMDFWNGNVQPVLDNWAAKFDEVWSAHIQPMLNNFIELLGEVADFLKIIWENILKPLIDWIIENVLPVILPIIDGVVDGIETAAGYISDAISGITDIFSGILEFLTGVFTGDWEKAWDGISDIVDGVKNTIKGIINAILGFVESMVNGVIHGINKISEKLNVLGSVKNPFTGKVVWEPNLPKLSDVSIPRLATGAVIPANKEFLAVLGDQKNGNNLEMPENLLRQIVREEAGSNRNSGGTYRFIGQINRRVLFDEFIEEAKMRQSANGLNPFYLK